MLDMKDPHIQTFIRIVGDAVNEYLHPYMQKPREGQSTIEHSMAFANAVHDINDMLMSAIIANTVKRMEGESGKVDDSWKIITLLALKAVSCRFDQTCGVAAKKIMTEG